MALCSVYYTLSDYTHLEFILLIVSVSQCGRLQKLPTMGLSENKTSHVMTRTWEESSHLMLSQC